MEGTEMIYKMELIDGNKMSKDEISTKAPIDDGKPMFYIDPNPLAVFTQKNDKELYIPVDRKEKDTEKRYYVIGHDRYFKTQERSLVDKLNNFLKKPDPKSNGEKEEELKTPEEEIILDSEMNTSGNRYFSHNVGEVCRRCKRTGHFERMCPEEPRVKCTYCMGPHNTERCSQFICFVCFKSGHFAKDCTASRSAVCYRCGKKGHKREECGMLMLKETHRDKKGTANETKCLKCHKLGHISCQYIHLGRKGTWQDDLFERQGEQMTKTETHPQQKKKAEHVYFAVSSDGENGQFEESDISEDLSDSHLKSFLKGYSREELQLMSSDESERELRKLKKHHRAFEKEKKELKFLKKIKSNQSDDRKKVKSKEKPKNGYRQRSKFVEKKIQEIKRDRKRSNSHSQPKIKKVKSY